MQRILASVFLLALAACADGAQAPTPTAAPGSFSSGTAAAEYMVVLRDDGGPGRGAAGARARVQSVADGVLARPERVFTHVFAGFSARLTTAQVAALRRRPDVAYVEPNAEVRLFTTQSNPISWGLDRVDDLNLPLDQSFTYNATGAGVTVYVLDSGIRLTHLDVVGRAAYIPNGSNGDFVGDGHGSAADCNGHGSHVAGTVGGTYSGVAKGVAIRAGRVVNCSGGGTTAMVISAMDWIAANGTRPAVVNMSLGYGNVQSVRSAAAALVDSGYTVVVAAGNGDFAGQPINACTEAPAGEPKVITVGATTSGDMEASFSNYGTCVDLLAPGVAIWSSSHLVDNQVVTRSGTSMAAPHVAGVAAQYLQLAPGASPALVWRAIARKWVYNTITLHSQSAANSTPNRFLYTDF